MLSRTASVRMRGVRNDAMQKRRMFMTVCATVLMLSLLSIYYSSFFNSRIHQRRSIASDEEADWVGKPIIRHTVVKTVDDLVGDDVSESKRDLGDHTEDQVDAEKGKDKYEKDEDKVDLDERLDAEDIDASSEDQKDEEGFNEVTLKTFPVCQARYSEVIPCSDRSLQVELKMKLNHTVMEHYERHCPPQSRRLNCLIPPPPNYKVPVKWPLSRDEIWQANVPHTFLALNKSDQHWMVIKGDKVNFPGGGTHFHDGADKYIAALGKMLGNENGDLSGKGKIRTVLDVGCGVASFGAYLLPLNIIAMSLAPNDVHANQIQFALERGIPSMVGVLGTQRLPYPSKSFDLAHCSRCRIDWTQRGGILLLEVDRVLRPGGYFAWSSPPAYRSTEEDRKEWLAMSSLVHNMCWKEAAKEGQTVIWVKPVTSECYEDRPLGTQPPLCSSTQDPDAAWKVSMRACITPLTKYSEDLLQPWPKRLTAPSPRLKELGINEKTYTTDMTVWQQRVEFYWKQLKLSKQVDGHSVRNVMDMNANFGGLAAALSSKALWTMNVVSAFGLNTLEMVYDRGLIGSLHDWCEAYSTYPRTYDLLHAWSVFSEIDQRGCSIEDLVLEMDRILRPKGIVIIRDKASIVIQVSHYLKALRWDHWLKEFEAEDDALSRGDEKILMARKQLWQPVDSS